MDKQYDLTINSLFAAQEQLRKARMGATAARDLMQSNGYTWLVPACDEKIAEIDELINRVRAVIDCDKSEVGDHDAVPFMGGMP